MADAGWYPDPQDPHSQQYFDGQDWTGNRRPAAVAPPSAAEAAPTQLGQAQPGWQSPPPQASPQAPPPQAPPQSPSWSPAAQNQPQYGAPQGPGQPPSAAPGHQQPWAPGGQNETRHVGFQPGGAPQQGSPQQGPPQQGSPRQGPPQQGTYQPAWQTPPPSQQPTSDPARPWEQPGQPGGWQQQPPPSAPKKSRRKPLLLALVAVVVVAAGLVTWLVWPSSSPSLTYKGKAVAAPADVLTKAEANVKALVTSRHGVKSADTRCYFALPKNPAKGTKKSDISSDLACGPVLFVDGDKAKTYLSVPLTLGSTKGGKANLVPQSTLTGLQPAALSSALELKRPDGKAAPAGAGGLAVPKPPAAAKDVLTVAALGPVTAPADLETASMVSKTTKIRLNAAGEVPRYGTGDTARSAPAGQKLIAFQVTTSGGDLSSSESAKPAIVVDGGTPQPLPDTTSTAPWIVVAVPSAGSAALQLNADGYNQTLALPTGKPGSGNLAVLTRAHRSGVITKTATIKFVAKGPGGSGSETVRTKISVVSLNFWEPVYPTNHASSPSRALLTVLLSYTDPKQPGKNFGFDVPQIHLRLPTGQTLNARNVASGNSIRNVFDVPATFTSGSVVISGSEKEQGVTVSVATAVSFPVSIPAG